MTQETLDLISDKLTSAGIHYEFERWNSDIVYPYFVGAYLEFEPDEETGFQESDMMLDGFVRGAYLPLDTAKNTIAKIFSNTTQMLSGGGAVNITYAGCLPVSTDGTDDLKRIQITLKIKEWSVEQ